MRGRLLGLLIAVLACTAFVSSAEAKKFRYASGPKAPEDTTLAVANSYLDPVVRSRGPRVPYTNLQLAQFVADSATVRALVGSPLEQGSHAVLAPAHDHPLNFVLEHSLIKELTRRGVEVTVRHAPVSDDSLALLYGKQGDPVVEYTLGSTRTSYLRLVGWLPGRVKLERQSLVQGSIVLRDPASSRVLWTADLGQNFVDRFSRGQVSLVEDPRYAELKDEVPSRNIDKVFEPILVVGVVGGLIALFFANRP